MGLYLLNCEGLLIFTGKKEVYVKIWAIVVLF